MPVEWQSNAPSAWLHETSYKELRHVRPVLSKQMTIFLHAIKLLIKRYSLPFLVSHRACLQVVGHSRSIAAFSHVPADYGEDDFRGFKTNLSHDTIVQYNRKCFDPKVHPQACTVAQENPRILWNRYFAVGGH